MPFYDLYVSYHLCVYNEELNANNHKWTGWIVTYMLSKIEMLGFKNKQDFNQWAEGLGMFVPKKKLQININKETEEANKKIDETFFTNTEEIDKLWGSLG